MTLQGQERFWLFPWHISHYIYINRYIVKRLIHEVQESRTGMALATLEKQELRFEEEASPAVMGLGLYREE